MYWFEKTVSDLIKKSLPRDCQNLTLDLSPEKERQSYLLQQDSNEAITNEKQIAELINYIDCGSFDS